MKDRILKAPDGGSGSHPNFMHRPGEIIPGGRHERLSSQPQHAAGEVIAAASSCARTKRIFP